MKNIGGNQAATLQRKTTESKNSIGEPIDAWVDELTLTGFLDFLSGESSHNSYNAKIQESSHVFVMDYQEMNLKEKDARLLINGDIYEITLMDDPMGLHKHIEIYLKYTGD